MNSKLIREIEVATDAWCDQNLPSDWTDRVDEYLPVWNDKFAELIVKECANIAREVGTSTNTEDFALDRCYEIEAKIEQHFGVEE